MESCVSCSKGQFYGWSCIIALQDTLKDLAIQMIEGLNQFLVILHCCPQQQEGVTTNPSPLPASQLHQMALVRAGDQAIDDVIAEVQVIIFF